MKTEVKQESKETSSYKKLFYMGQEDGYEAGKNDCLNEKVNLDIFSDENRVLSDGYTIGFEVGYLRAICEYNIL